MYRQCAVLFAVILLTACSDLTGKRGLKERTALLKTVPSDAVAVVCDRQISGISSALDSRDPLRALFLGELTARQAVLSIGYTGEKATMLSVFVDTTQFCRQLMFRADSLGLLSRRVKLDGYDILTVSSSGTMTSESQHHIRSGTCIFNAPFFSEAYSESGASDRVVFIRNQAIPRLLPKGFLSKLMPRRQLSDFLRGAACWTTIENRRSVTTFQNAEPVYYGHICKSFPTGELRIREILPENANFVLSQPAGPGKWRESRKMYLDAQAVLDRYQRAVSDYARADNPEQWERSNCIVEAAVILLPEGKVLALRSDGWTEDACATFDPGFAGLLYGKAYSLQESQSVTVSGQWLLAGNDEAVNAVVTEIDKNTEDRLKACRFYIRTPEFDFFGNDEDWSLELSNEKSSEQ